MNKEAQGKETRARGRAAERVYVYWGAPHSASPATRDSGAGGWAGEQSAPGPGSGWLGPAEPLVAQGREFLCPCLQLGAKADGREQKPEPGTADRASTCGATGQSRKERRLPTEPCKRLAP